MAKDAGKGIAVGKRIKISKYQKQMLLSVLVAAVVLGIGIVVSVFFVKYITFNAKVLNEKQTAITDYKTALENAKFLNGEVLALSDNEALESVASGTVKECYNSDGKKIDYNILYQEAKTEEEETEYLKMMKQCSALRVIPDALPANRNDEALMSSLDQIFKLSEWEPESLSPNGSATTSTIPGIGVIPVSLAVEADAEKTFRVLDNIEKSIRSFDIQTAVIAWSSSKLELRAQAQAYFTKDSSVEETTKTVYASNEARKVAK